MHEFAIAQSLVDVARKEATRAGARRVTALDCRIGVLRQIEPQLMVDAFGLAAQGTICEDAELRIEKVRVSADCPQCGQRFMLQNDDWRCPACRTNGENFTGGDELELVSLEAEVDE